MHTTAQGSFLKEQLPWRAIFTLLGPVKITLFHPRLSALGTEACAAWSVHNRSVVPFVEGKNGRGLVRIFPEDAPRRLERVVRIYDGRKLPRGRLKFQDRSWPQRARRRNVAASWIPALISQAIRGGLIRRCLFTIARCIIQGLRPGSIPSLLFFRCFSAFPFTLRRTSWRNTWPVPSYGLWLLLCFLRCFFCALELLQGYYAVRNMHGDGSPCWVI